MQSYLKTHLFLQLPYGFLSILHTLMQLFLVILTQFISIEKAKEVRVNFTLMTLVIHFTLIFAWHYKILYNMAINNASLIIVEGGQLLDATIAASLAISLSRSGVTQMHKVLRPKVGVMATKAIVIKAMVMVMFGVMGQPAVGPKLCMPISSRGIQCISLKGINQGHMVIISIGQMRLSQEVSLGTAP